MHTLSRRRFLAATAAAGAFGAAPALLVPRAGALADEATTLRVETRTIEVNGKPAKVYGLLQPDGTHGLATEAGRRFRVRLENRIDEATLIHWHGLTPPWRQDGVPDLSQPALQPGESYEYDFPLERAGTNWMHSHKGLQEQRLMAAPLIVRDPAEASEDVQEVVVLFHDFTFRDPDEVLAELQAHGHGNGGHGDGGHGMGQGNDHGSNGHGSGGHGDDGHAMGHGGGHGNGDADHATAVHLHDVDYDAFLANDRTLRDPEVHRVERGGRVRLRLINAATATNFWIDLDRLEGELIAVDGRSVRPLKDRRFPFAIAQRLDIMIDLPRETGAWPIFARREGERARTGVVLATKDARVEKLSEHAHHAEEPVDLSLEHRLLARSPLTAREADRAYTIKFSEGANYAWKLDGAVFGNHTPLKIREGERVEITFADDTTMAHPMHLHGHHFQVVAINGERFDGAMRDTVLVPARGRVTIAFDADNPGKWALHCHHLFHMAGGMMTTLEYAEMG